MDRYPLTWPTGQPRLAPARRQHASFKVDFVRSRDEMLHSLSLLGARDVILSTNVRLRLDGLPLASMTEPVDPGVAVYFNRQIGQDRRPFAIACDSYTKVRWNLRAIGATVEGLRSIQRHGASSMLEQAFTGFAALPPAQREDPWWKTLGVSENADLATVNLAYKELARRHHPDVGGDTDTMTRIDRAMAEAKRGPPSRGGGDPK